MEALTLSQIAGWCGGRVAGAAGETLVRSVGTDTRALAPGCLFVALQGANFDGHRFAADAVRSGAAAVMAARSRAAELGDLPRIEVDDTLEGLQRAAEGYRGTLSLRSVAITGSNGKTSTKEMCAAVLAQGYRTVKTRGNLNNHIGVPLMMFEADRSHQAGVFEMGMNHAGELAPLVRIGRPEVGVVTGVGPVHIENFPDEAAIAEEKATVVRGVPASGHAVLNADDRWCDAVARGVSARIVRVGIASRNADIRAENLESRPEGTRFEIVEGSGRVEAFLPLPGRHMVGNALLAAAVGRILGLDWPAVVRGLAAVEVPGMRLQRLEVGGVTVINDAYNANPVSMRAALQTFREMVVPGRRVAVLGDMFELGDMASAAHREAGAEAARTGVEDLVVLGGFGAHTADGAVAEGLPAASVHRPATHEEAARLLKEKTRPGDAVLLKASRGAKLEEVVAAWRRLLD